MVEQEDVPSGDVDRRRAANHVLHLRQGHEFCVERFEPRQVFERVCGEFLPAFGKQRGKRKICHSRIGLAFEIGAAGFDDIADVVLAGGGKGGGSVWLYPNNLLASL